MSSFNLPNFSQFENWDHSKTESKGSLESQWHHESFLQLKGLSNQPFDILEAIQSKEAENSTITESDEPSVDSMHSFPEEQIDQEQLQDDIWTQPDQKSKLFTLSWETKRQHFPSPIQVEMADYTTPFLTESSTGAFEPLLTSLAHFTIKQDALVKGLLQAIAGLPSVYFNWSTTEKRFKSRVSFRILDVSNAATEPIIEHLLLFGTYLKHLDYVAQQCTSNPSRYGLVGMAFGSCVSELCLYIQRSIMNIFNTAEELSLLYVYHHIDNLSLIVQKMVLLCHINDESENLTPIMLEHIRTYGFYIPFGCDILTLLFNEIQQLDLIQSGNISFYKNICLSILTYTSIPYLSILSRWLGLKQHNNTEWTDFNRIHDPYSEFFICEKPNPVDALDTFKLQSNPQLPYFINSELSMYIFRSGMSLHFLRETLPSHPLCNLQEDMALSCIFLSNKSEVYIERLLELCALVRRDEGFNYHETDNVVLTENTTETKLFGASWSNNLNRFSLPNLDEMDVLTGQFAITLSLIIETNNTNTHDYFIPTLDTITIENYIRPLQIWCPLLNESFMTCFLTRFKLEYHLSLLHDYFLLANGVFASGLKSVFYQDSRRPLTLLLNGNRAHIWPPRSFDLNMVLRALLLESSSSGEDLITFGVRKDNSTKRWTNPNAVEALDFLYLSYDPRYPLNVLINPPVIDKYNRIFTFLLRLQRAMYLTKEIHKVLTLRSKIGYWKGEVRDDVLHKYRFEFDQFIAGFQGYVHDSVISVTWSHFMYQVNEMKHHTADMPSDLMEPSTFCEFHEHILDRILFQCFLKQSQQRVYKVFLPILEDLFAFADCIENEKNESRLFNKCHSIHSQFTEHRNKFIATLIQVEKDGSGRLYNILNSTNNNRFQYLFVNQGELDVFVRDLLTRLCVDTEYKK